MNCGERVKWRNNWKGVQKKRNIIQGFLFLVCFFCTQQILTVQAAAQEQLFCYVRVSELLYSQVRPFITMHTWDLLQRGPCWWEGYPFAMCSIGLQLNCLINVEKKSKITWTKHRSPKVRRLFFFEQRTVICLMQASEVEKWYWHTLTLISHSN